MTHLPTHASKVKDQMGQDSRSSVQKLILVYYLHAQHNNYVNKIHHVRMGVQTIH